VEINGIIDLIFHKKESFMAFMIKIKKDLQSIHKR